VVEVLVVCKQVIVARKFKLQVFFKVDQSLLNCIKLKSQLIEQFHVFLIAFKINVCADFSTNNQLGFLLDLQTLFLDVKR
jgi:hypothetical protein